MSIIGFNFEKPIYRQIMDKLTENIVYGDWKDGDRIPAVREVAVEYSVNPNTVMRAYDALLSMGVLVNKRGVGFFVADGAQAKIIESRRMDVLTMDMPELFERMYALEIPFEKLAERYEYFKKRKEQ